MEIIENTSILSNEVCNENDAPALPLMTYTGETDNAGRPATKTWDQIAKLLHKRDVRQAKSGAAFSPTLYKYRTTRAKANVLLVSLAVADIDDGTTLDQLRPAIARFSWVAYSSHSHTAKHPKFRIVFPLIRACTTAEWTAVWEGLNQLLGGHCDTACKDASRLYFLPSCPPETEAEAFYVRNAGQLVDPDEIKVVSDAAGDGDNDINTALLGGDSDPFAPYPFLENREDFHNALCAACPDPKTRDVWRLGSTALAFLVVVHRWPEAEARLMRESWENCATGGKQDDNEKDWQDALERTAERIKIGNAVTSHLSVLKAAREAGWVPVATHSDPVLQAIQDRFALIVLKKIGVVDRAALTVRGLDEMAASLTVLSREDGALLIRRLVQSGFPRDAFGDRAKQFFTHPKTVCYGGVEFNPHETTPAFLNLWVGPTISPRQGDWGFIQDFLLTVICGESQAAYFYLIRYMAHALQRPWEKPGTMIVMIGGEGIGKGTLARIIRKIWTATFLHTHTIKPIVGDFTGPLERSYWVFLDEAVFAGDKAGTNALKALITEPTIYINEKNQPGRTIRSYHRFIAATNAEHFKHIDPDNRRDFVLKVSDARKGDKAYWDDLTQAIDGGEAEAMMFDLLAIDLSGFDVRTKPNTKELTQQKLQSLQPYHRWWFDCLSRGSFEEWKPDWPNFVSTFTLTMRLRAATQGIRTYKQVIDRDIKDMVRKVCPSVVDDQAMEDNHRRRGFKLPTLDKAREDFEKFIGDTVDWS